MVIEVNYSARQTNNNTSDYLRIHICIYMDIFIYIYYACVDMYEYVIESMSVYAHK